jgi:PDZ domain-containing protein
VTSASTRRRPPARAGSDTWVWISIAPYEASARLQISAIVPLGPAALGSGIQRGEYVLAIDGEAIGRQANLDALLDNRVNRRVLLKVTKDAAGAGARDVAVRPIALATERGLRYRQWVEERREYAGQGERRPARLRKYAPHVGGVARAAAHRSMPTTSRATASSSTCATTTAGS